MWVKLLTVSSVKCTLRECRTLSSDLRWLSFCWSGSAVVMLLLKRSRPCCRSVTLIGQFANKPTHGQSSRRQRMFKNYWKTALYLYPKPNRDPNPFDCWRWTNSVIYGKSHYSDYVLCIFCSTFRQVDWLISSRLDGTRVGLSANCPVAEHTPFYHPFLRRKPSCEHCK